MAARQLGLILMMCAVISSCTSPPYKAYSGPELPTDRVAVLSLNPRGDLITFSAVDGAEIEETQHDILVLPGQRAVLVRAYNDSSIFGKHLLDPDEGTFSFEAVAGHSYTVRAERAGGGTKALRLQVIDMSDGRVVGDVQ